MSVYLVAFQIDEDNMENQNYDDFAEALQEYDGYCQIFDNLWFVCSDGSADDVHEDLVQHLYDGDFYSYHGNGRRLSRFPARKCR